jgi:hypothetical protein
MQFTCPVAQIIRYDVATDRRVVRQEDLMPSDTPVHDFLLPRIVALVKEAEEHGIQREVAVAVLIDIVTAPRFDTAAPPADSDSAPHPDYERSPDLVTVDGVSMAAPRAIGAQDEADFVRPARWDR